MEQRFLVDIHRMLSLWIVSMPTYGGAIPVSAHWNLRTAEEAKAIAEKNDVWIMERERYEKAHITWKGFTIREISISLFELAMELEDEKKKAEQDNQERNTS